ncbi:hypothetical protein UlMin_039956 [Ulmus minor]
MGEGLLEARGGIGMEDVGEEYFKILTSMSFFQPSVSVRDCRSCFIMHDCVHDLATFVLGDFGFRLEENNLHNLPRKTQHLSIMFEKIHDSEQFDGISNADCLRTFLPLGYSTCVNMSRVIPLKFLMEKGCLRVLTLYHCGIAELPDSIGNLKHLRYLDVSYTSIKEIPDTICTLYNLETLLLKECTSLTRLPTDIGCLIKLGHLDFSKHADSTIKELGCFQNLHGELRIWGLENVVDVKNVCEAKLRDKKFITELRLLWDEYSDDYMKDLEILDQLQPHTSLKELCIKGYSGTRLSDWMGDQSFSSIVQVELINCENCSSLWPLDQLPSLKTLLISESFRRVETINWELFSSSSSMTKPFRSLESLYFGAYDRVERVVI